MIIFVIITLLLQLQYPILSNIIFLSLYLSAIYVLKS